MKTINFAPREQQVLKDIYAFSKSKRNNLYLVGGILRDKLLGRERENPDFDFCLMRGAISLGAKLAKKLKAGFVVLDKEHGACRLVKALEGKFYTFDFTDFRGTTIEKDLLHRDFAINAIAVELERIFKSKNLDKELIDPYDGKGDLENKIIKIVQRSSFSEDPLRILRAFSFACTLGFNINKDTLKLAKKEKDKLTDVSAERIRDELFKIFLTQRAYNCVATIDKLKILQIIFPEFRKMRGIGQGPYHHLDVWQHTLETVRQLEGLMEELKGNWEIQDYLNEFIAADRRRSQLLKLGALLHDVGKPAALRHQDGKIIFHGHERIGLEICEEIAKRLRLSNDEIHALRKIVLCHLRPGYMADNKELTPRAKFRFFRDAANEAIGVLLLSIADQRATKGPLTTNASRINHEKVVFGLIKEYFKKKKEKKIARLINGHDLMRKFGLGPSPLIGKILSEIEELQAIGKLKTKEEAYKIAKRIIR